MTSDWVPGRLIPTNLLIEIKAAEAAAIAARAVPGVVRLQPGVRGLLRHFAAQAWTQATGKALPDLAGVQADLTHDQLQLDLRIVVSIYYQAAEVGQAVTQAATLAVVGLADVPSQVRTHIVEVDLEPI
jgi:hypothetical protein